VFDAMSEQHAPAGPDLLGTDLTACRRDLLHRFREEVQREVAAQLAAGHIIYYCGTGDEAGRLFMHTPDDRRFEYRIRADGTREIVRELPQ
jgi:hypothetical protein